MPSRNERVNSKDLLLNFRLEPIRKHRNTCSRSQQTKEVHVKKNLEPGQTTPKLSLPLPNFKKTSCACPRSYVPYPLTKATAGSVIRTRRTGITGYSMEKQSESYYTSGHGHGDMKLFPASCSEGSNQDQRWKSSDGPCSLGQYEHTLTCENSNLFVPISVHIVSRGIFAAE